MLNMMPLLLKKLSDYYIPNLDPNPQKSLSNDAILLQKFLLFIVIKMNTSYSHDNCFFMIEFLLQKMRN